MSLATVVLIAIAAIVVILMIRVGFANREAARSSSGHDHGEDGGPPAPKAHSGHGGSRDGRHGCC